MKFFHCQGHCDPVSGRFLPQQGPAGGQRRPLTHIVHSGNLLHKGGGGEVSGDLCQLLGRVGEQRHIPLPGQLLESRLVLLHDVFTRVQSFAFENIDKFSSASLVTRMTTDINNVQMSFMMCIRIAVRAPLMFLFAVIMAYIMGGALATTFLIIIPVLVIGLLLIARKAMPAFRAVFRKYDKLNESVEENVRAMRVVKGFAREGYEKQKFAAASHDIAKDFTFAERVVALNAPLMQFCVYFNLIFVLFVGSRIIITNGGTTIDVGQLSAMLTYGMQILMSLMMISMIYVMMTMSYESFVRICEVLEEEPALTDPASPAMDVKDGSIDFENVSFKYSAQAKKFALQDINLHIDSGMTVGILGGTGSSKSTLVQLIPRLYDVSEGCVKVGGRDVREYDLEALRGAVSVVLQKNVLFSGTVKDNLRWGNENATDDEMIEACRLAQADEFVRSFPGRGRTCRSRSVPFPAGCCT